MIVSHYNLCNLVLSFSWTFISQSRLKFVFCKRIWSKDVFLISTQWIFSWLDNHRLIRNWWWSCKDIILSVLIKIFDIFFFDSLFTLNCAAHLQQLLTTLLRNRRELKNSYMWVLYSIQYTNYDSLYIHNFISFH